MTRERAYWQNRITRRRALAGTLASGAGLAALAAACGSSSKRPSNTTTGGSVGGAASTGGAATPAGSPAAKQPKRGGTLLHPMANEFLWAGYDPHVGNQAQGSSLALFYQTLVARNIHTVLSDPLLAQKWEQPSPTEYLFRLTPGVKFHNRPPVNGRALTADDVVFSLNRVRRRARLRRRGGVRRGKSPGG